MYFQFSQPSLESQNCWQNPFYFFLMHFWAVPSNLSLGELTEFLCPILRDRQIRTRQIYMKGAQRNNINQPWFYGVHFELCVPACHPSASLLPNDSVVASSYGNFHVWPGCWCMVPFLQLVSVCFDLIALILQNVQLQVKIQDKYFSCGWYRIYICNLTFLRIYFV